MLPIVIFFAIAVNIIIIAFAGANKYSNVNDAYNKVFWLYQTLGSGDFLGANIMHCF